MDKVELRGYTKIDALSKNLPIDSQLSSQLITRFIEIFGPGPKESLGFYTDIDRAKLYADIYRFFFHLQVSIEERRYARRLGKEV